MKKYTHKQQKRTQQVVCVYIQFAYIFVHTYTYIFTYIHITTIIKQKEATSFRWGHGKGLGKGILEGLELEEREGGI